MAAIIFNDLLLFHNDNNPLIEVEPLWSSKSLLNSNLKQLNLRSLIIHSVFHDQKVLEFHTFVE